jgi:cell shape-determining protein MreD
MRQTTFKISLGLCLFFLLDLRKPFGYALCVDFLFVGILFTALNYRSRFSVIAAIISGFLKDCAAANTVPFHLLTLTGLAITIRNILAHFYKTEIKTLIAIGTILIYTGLNTIFYAGIIPVTFAVFFILNSYMLLFLLTYILKNA